MNIIDIVIILCVLFIAFVGAGRGFFKSLSGVAVYILSGIAAKLTSAPISGEVYERFFRQKVLEILEAQFPSGSVQGEINGMIDGLLEAFPQSLRAIAENFALTLNIPQSGDAVLTVSQLEADYAAPVLIKVIGAVATVVVFLLCVLLLRVIFNAFDSILFKRKKKGILSGMNRFLGFVLGLVQACVIIGIVCVILNIIAPLTHSQMFIEYVNSSVVCGYVAQII